MIDIDKEKLAKLIASQGGKLVKLNSNSATILMNDNRIKIVNGDFTRMIRDYKGVLNG